MTTLTLPPVRSFLPTCDTCKYFVSSIEEAAVTICRRFPPQCSAFVSPAPPGSIPGSMQFHNSVSWPRVKREDSCGEHAFKIVNGTEAEREAGRISTKIGGH